MTTRKLVAILCMRLAVALTVAGAGGGGPRGLPCGAFAGVGAITNGKRRGLVRDDDGGELSHRQRVHIEEWWIWVPLRR